MIETKYLIIIGAVISLLILYYFYDEMSNTKKIIMPTYQKTMLLESKLIDLEKKTDTFILNFKNQVQSHPQNQPTKNNRKKPIDSPALSITYQSDMINKNSGNNLSVMYADLTETEINEMRKKLELNKKVSGEKNPSPKKSPEKSDPHMFNFLSPEQNKNQVNSQTQHNLNSTLPYQQILDNMSSPDWTQGSKKLIDSDGNNIDTFSNMFDSEVVKCISDSVNCVDLDQTHMSEISEIPVTSEIQIDSDAQQKQNKKVNKTLLRKKINKKRNSK